MSVFDWVIVGGLVLYGLGYFAFTVMAKAMSDI